MGVSVDEVLNRWASGKSGGQIRREFNLSRNRVSQIICEARKRRDFRAIHHKWADGELIGRYRHRPPETS